MKKYLVHLGYLLVIAFFVLYAGIKAREAETQAELAEKNAFQAQRQAELALEQAAEAARQNYLAMEKTKALEEVLKNCQTGKK